MPYRVFIISLVVCSGFVFWGMIAPGAHAALPGQGGSGTPCTQNTDCASLLCATSEHKCLPKSAGSDANSGAATGSGLGGSAEGKKFSDVAFTVDSIYKIIINLTCQTVRLASFAVVFFIVYAGLQFMRAGGDPKAFEAARKNILYVVVGIAIIAGVSVIIATVTTAIGVEDYSILSCSGT